MGSEQVSRRAVARGAAWTVPLVAVGVAAPAFAASVGGPVVSAGTGSCKCPGGGSPYVYYADLVFVTPGSANWSITITGVKFENDTQVFSPTPPSTNPQVLPGGDGTIRIQTSSNRSDSTRDLTITYTATNLTTLQSLSITKTLIGVKFDVCKSPVVCP